MDHRSSALGPSGHWSKREIRARPGGEPVAARLALGRDSRGRPHPPPSPHRWATGPACLGPSGHRSNRESELALARAGGAPAPAHRSAPVRRLGRRSNRDLGRALRRELVAAALTRPHPPLRRVDGRLRSNILIAGPPVQLRAWGASAATAEAQPNPRPMFANPPGLLRVEPHSPGLRDRSGGAPAPAPPRSGRPSRA